MMKRRKFFAALSAVAIAPFATRRETPVFASGGYITSRTMLGRGYHGPETVVPLSKVTINLDGRALAEALALEIPRVVRRSGL